MTTDIMQMIIGSGVLAQGFAMLRWAMRLESRVAALELQRRGRA
jgi:hypothetical protein